MEIGGRTEWPRNLMRTSGTAWLILSQFIIKKISVSPLRMERISKYKSLVENTESTENWSDIKFYTIICTIFCKKFFQHSPLLKGGLIYQFF